MPNKRRTVEPFRLGLDVGDHRIGHKMLESVDLRFGERIGVAYVALGATLQPNAIARFNSAFAFSHGQCTNPTVVEGANRRSVDSPP